MVDKQENVTFPLKKTPVEKSQHEWKGSGFRKFSYSVYFYLDVVKQSLILKDSDTHTRLIQQLHL